MADIWDGKQTCAVGACANLLVCVDKGMVDSDVVVSTWAGLVANIVARRDGVTTKGGQRAPFDALLQSLQTLRNQGVFGATAAAQDAAADALVTVAATPFVAGVATDLLSVLATNLPSSIADPRTGGPRMTFFGAQSYQGA